MPTPVEKVEVTLAFRGEYDDILATPVVNSINKLIQSMKGTISRNQIVAEPTPDVLFLRFSLAGSNKVDVAYRLEQMISQQGLPGMTADITRSRFVHQLEASEPLATKHVVALEQREIVSQSPVSIIAPYHTALIVTAAASAFVIFVLTLLLILYRRKVIIKSCQ